MKRAKRQTIARGLSGKQMKRLRAILSRTRFHARGASIRNARRLAEAGLARIENWKQAPWDRIPREVTIVPERP